MKQKRLLLTSLYLVMTTFIILLPAIYNGYPFVTGDSGGYLSMATNLHPSSFRPLGYSIFIWLFNWNNSLWPVIFIQSLILNLTLFFTLNALLKTRDIYISHVLLVVVLSLLNNMGLLAGQIMTDIFIPISILMVFLLFSQPKLQWWKIVLFALFFALTSAMHYSQLLLYFALALILIIINLFKKTKERYNLQTAWHKLAVLILPVIISMVLLKVYIKSFDSYAEYGGGKYVFVMGRLCESGILKDYLDVNCDEKDMPICKYKEKLPNTALEFMWSSKSPYHKDKLKMFEADEQYKPIVMDIISSPEYWWRLFIVEGTTQTWKQLYTMHIGHGLNSKGEKTYFYKFFKSAYPGEFEKYIESKQYKKELEFKWLNTLNVVLLIVSLFVILVILTLFKTGNSIRFLSIIILSGYVLNAAISSNLANVSYRLGGRAAWLIIFLAGIMIAGVATKQVRLGKSKPSETGD